jgi:MIP family channel proteins
VVTDSATEQLPLGRRAVAELVGTLAFVFVGAGSAVSTQYIASSDPGFPSLILIALANGGGLAIGISATMNLSGGQLNPAVTIGALVARKISVGDAAVYIVSQVVGATIAAYLLMASLPSAFGDPVHWGTPALGPQTSVAQGILLEAIMTFFLVMVVFGTAIDARAPKLGGFAIGLIVVADVIVGGPFTGAAMNPARATGPAIASMTLNNLYVWWVGPILGAIVAAIVYKYAMSKI